MYFKLNNFGPKKIKLAFKAQRLYSSIKKLYLWYQLLLKKEFNMSFSPGSKDNLTVYFGTKRADIKRRYLHVVGMGLHFK